VVLSSGFLAFAAHAGFLQAVEDAGLPVGGVMGTSAGALTGALWCAGHAPSALAAELSAVPPIARLRACARPWAGLLTMEAVIARLRDLVPPTFEDLPREFAVGVVTRDGAHVVIDSGPLPEAVAASAAIPALFAPVSIPGREGVGPFKDGGVVDRTGLRQWRARRRREAAAAAGGGEAGSADSPPPALVHLIGRSSAFSGDDDVAASGEGRVVLVKSPKAGVSLLSLGDFEWQLASARSRARPAVRAALEGRWQF
jgi:predicted acylesterase/phospholipase RssA